MSARNHLEFELGRFMLVTGWQKWFDERKSNEGLPKNYAQVPLLFKNLYVKYGAGKRMEYLLYLSAPRGIDRFH